jgi:hypothetical protein
MGIATGLSALKTGTDLLRVLRDRLKSGEVKGEEVIGRIGEIYDYIVDSKDSLVDAKDEIHDLKEKLRVAEGKLLAADDAAAFKASLKYNESSGVWTRVVDGVSEGYCGACLNESKRVRLKRSTTGTYSCQYHGYRNSN